MAVWENGGLTLGPDGQQGPALREAIRAKLEREGEREPHGLISPRRQPPSLLFFNIKAWQNSEQVDTQGKLSRENRIEVATRGHHGGPQASSCSKYS